MEKDSPNISVHPMIVFGLMAIAGYGINRIWPLAYPITAIPDYIGYVIAACGGLLLLLASREFSRHNTSDSCSKCATALITTGPFRYSRNPVYLGFVLILIGFSVKSNNLWLLILTIPLILAVNQLIIAKEEAHLARIFDQKYTHYKASVRRWL